MFLAFGYLMFQRYLMGYCTRVYCISLDIMALRGSFESGQASSSFSTK